MRSSFYRDRGTNPIRAPRWGFAAGTGGGRADQWPRWRLLGGYPASHRESGRSDDPDTRSPAPRNARITGCIDRRRSRRGGPNSCAADVDAVAHASTILRHIADTEARAYPRWCGLPQLEPVDDLREELSRSAKHIREVILDMPRSFKATHRHETWTPVKLLRRLAYHERLELIFLRRRLHVR